MSTLENEKKRRFRSKNLAPIRNGLICYLLFLRTSSDSNRFRLLRSFLHTRIVVSFVFSSLPLLLLFESSQTITLLFAGQDTSAATLSWTLHLLSLPENREYLLEVRRANKIADSTDYTAEPFLHMAFDDRLDQPLL